MALGLELTQPAVLKVNAALCVFKKLHQVICVRPIDPSSHVE